MRPSGHGNLEGSKVAAAKVTEGLFPVRAEERIRLGRKPGEGGRRLSGEWSPGLSRGGEPEARGPAFGLGWLLRAGQVLRRGKVRPRRRGFRAGLHLAGPRGQGFVSSYNVQPLAPRLRVPEIRGTVRRLQGDHQWWMPGKGQEVLPGERLAVLTSGYPRTGGRGVQGLTAGTRIP